MQLTSDRLRNWRARSVTKQTSDFIMRTSRAIAHGNWRGYSKPDTELAINSHGRSPYEDAAIQARTPRFAPTMLPKVIRSELGEKPIHLRSDLIGKAGLWRSNWLRLEPGIGNEYDKLRGNDALSMSITQKTSDASVVQRATLVHAVRFTLLKSEVPNHRYGN